MSEDFTDGQKAIIRELTKEQIDETLRQKEFIRTENLKSIAVKNGILTEENVSRGLEGDEGAKVQIPDTAKSNSITLKAIVDWQQSRARWWEIRKRLDTKLAGLGVIGVLVLGGIDLAWKERALFGDAMHWVAGTDDRVTEQVEALVAGWKGNTQTETTAALNAAFEHKISTWATSETFEAKSHGALLELAKRSSAQDNPLKDFVRAALDENPVLMFQGQAVLGGGLSVEVTNDGCLQLVEHWSKNRQELLPVQISDTAEPHDRVRGLCKIVGLLPQGDWFDVPFFARFHNSRTAPSDEVLLVLQVRRTIAEVNVEQVSSETIQNSAQKLSPFDRTLDGLVVEYNSSNAALINKDQDTVTLKLENRNNTFFVGRVDTAVVDALNIQNQRDTNIAEYDLIHSISIAYDEKWRGKQEFVGDEVIQIRAIVLVNKGIRE